MNKKTQERGDFSGISQKFSKSIYDTTKGRLRMEVLERDLAPLLSAQPCLLLDVGAGLGQVNQWFQKKGFSVVHSDLSTEMVEEAERRHKASGLGEQCEYLSASLADLVNQQPPTQYDIILCHAVLEWLPDTELALQQLASLLKPGGTLSLMFYNHHAQLFANAIYGNFDYIERGLKVKKTVRLSPQNPAVPEDVDRWLQIEGLEVQQKTGVRCFHDYLRNIEHQQRFDELLALEMKYNQLSPYRELGRYQHWLIKKTDGKKE
ncbi:methyltransferase domain-containing protein [Idiomarina sp. HP20-50]|uniref:methyltransferase domain-containing protein n=1 Tax=Idiomarina sp. HP20-50 TaxID=3070813 RepID=UPI00294B520E|nr:methyltransferase domain-containing protein [Idiomarina sp. HP20-50]MDV6315026.1 methyltransferase domain-containing protein [Idiomarina sp. HP20-50]